MSFVVGIKNHDGRIALIATDCCRIDGLLAFLVLVTLSALLGCSQSRDAAPGDTIKDATASSVRSAEAEESFGATVPYEPPGSEEPMESMEPTETASSEDSESHHSAESSSTAERIPRYAMPEAAIAPSVSPPKVSSSPKQLRQQEFIDGLLPLDAKVTTSSQNAMRQMDLFYATDRLPTEALLPARMRLLAPVLAALVTGMIFFVGWANRARLRPIWLAGCLAAALVALYGAQRGVIRFQQGLRLSTNADTAFTGLRSEASTDYPLHLGRALVSIPPNHQPGRVETPKIWKLEFVESPDRHIMLHKIQREDLPDRWYSRMRQEAQQADRSEVFVFVHGYNVDFAEALKRTAQLSHDLGVQGPTVCYSWPSRGQVLAYTADEATVSWSAPHFERLLSDIHQRTQVHRVNVIAHSMGSRAALEALERIYLKSSQLQASVGSGKTIHQRPIHQLILAAPDVDAVQFEARYLIPLRKLSHNATIYFSRSDRALQLSAGIHAAPRLGLAANILELLDGIEVIHIGSHDLFGLGHSYYGTDPVVIDDLSQLLSQDVSASERPLLRRIAPPGTGSEYWELDRGRFAKLQGETRSR
jgi:esterase/lipase superfamily enzyme